MNPHKVTIQQLFTMQCRHLIPIFQRQYVWDARDQWEPLWDDITQKAREVLNITPGGRQLRKHFMGAVVLRAIAPNGLEYQAYEVIDGQQRLTTLQVLMIALRDYSKQKNLGRSLTLLNGMTANPPLSGSEYEQLKVLPTTRDRADFVDVFECQSPEELLRRRPPIRRKYARRDDPQPKLIAAYHFFYDVIRQFAETADDELDDSATIVADAETIARRVESLVRAITQQLELVRIDLDHDDDPQVIFETLNARGVKLWPGDLVRNYVFLEATRRHGSQAKVKDLYDTYWRHYDETATAAFWKEHVRQGRLVNPRFELFLFHFLTSKLKRPEDDIQLQHLYRSFCEWWDTSEGAQPRDVEQALQEIQVYSAFYHRLFEQRDDDRLATFGRRLRIMDVSTIYPLVLFLFVEREQETTAEIDGLLTDLESYLVRRLICGLTTKSYNRIFVKLLTDLRKAGPISRGVVQQHLLNMTGPTAEWPSDDLLRERWLTSPVYQNLRQSRIVMILEALEWQQYGPKQEHQRPPSTTPYTIEHILPQSPSEDDWPLPLPADADEETRLAIVMTREALKHTIGNLTLVTSPMNSGLGNRPFLQKRQAFDTQSTLMLSKYFIKHGIDTWGEAQIRERGERLLTEAITIWPRP
ncbi:DUF262 domain-containing protein [Candidatus Chloroploca sp. M-50]|uniref:DUF262 domain-containing protein n=1 Tax=Candidatus Chloroploca mongolica TaxID=2528176 RepID=A0ABS4D9Y6_9CHLR|nr:DUF262 domain-containing protein [Candidatus Chloroploca mongolica]MBP1466241.1 DUF262 domain-containing protein [Candidatus Chloroploca mongolica]